MAIIWIFNKYKVKINKRIHSYFNLYSSKKEEVNFNQYHKNQLEYSILLTTDKLSRLFNMIFVYLP